MRTSTRILVMTTSVMALQMALAPSSIHTGRRPDMTCQADSLLALKWSRPAFIDSVYKGKVKRSAIPYRDVFASYSIVLGWEWELLAAMAYQESHFNMHAHSSKGAVGIMQMKPSTASPFGIWDLEDPVQCISASVGYLSHLSGCYRGFAADASQRRKLSVAAYNAGLGHIHDCIVVARSRGMDPHTWEELVEVIPQMRDSSNLVEGVRCGTFIGDETVAYVDAVFNMYEILKKLDP